MTETFVVIGGDAAGMSAASKAKREDPGMNAIVLERGEWVSYAACGMPYFIEGRIPSLDDLVHMTATEFREERDIDLRTGHEAVAIDPEARSVSVEPEGGDPYELDYDDLLLATGARAIVPPFEGMDLEGVFTIHDMDEAAAIDGYLDRAGPERAVVVGGGYVGIEMAEALVGRGLSVDLYEMLPHVLQPFGEPVADAVEEELRERGVGLHLDTAVEGFTGGDAVEAVEADDGTAPAELVIVGVGVTPNVELAADAGIEIGPSGAIATDDFGRTDAERIYAAGDCAEATDVVTGEPTHVPLALTANRAGRAIGQTVAGQPRPVGPTAGTAIVKAFELGAARTGIVDPETASSAGFDPETVTIEAPTRAGYYPGAEPLRTTLVADRQSGRVLGGSVVGREGAKRIDTVAAALHAGMTVEELQNLDLAYAPPFSPVWDPILTAAKVLGGKLSA